MGSEVEPRNSRGKIAIAERHDTVWKERPWFKTLGFISHRLFPPSMTLTIPEVIDTNTPAAERTVQDLDMLRDKVARTCSPDGVEAADTATIKICHDTL